MVDIEEITKTITELESGETTFDSCLKLASLYICRDNVLKSKYEDGNNVNDVITEYSDILPSYYKYCDCKKEYQLGYKSEDYVTHSMVDLCTEIEEFIQTLFRNTESPDDRNLIIQTIQKLTKVGEL